MMVEVQFIMQPVLAEVRVFCKIDYTQHLLLCCNYKGGLVYQAKEAYIIGYLRWKFKLVSSGLWCIICCAAGIRNPIVVNGVSKLICVLLKTLEQFEILFLHKLVGSVVWRRIRGDADIFLLQLGPHNTSQDSYDIIQSVVGQSTTTTVSSWYYFRQISPFQIPRLLASAVFGKFLLHKRVRFTVGNSSIQRVLGIQAFLVVIRILHKLVRVQYLRWKFRFSYQPLMKQRTAYTHTNLESTDSFCTSVFLFTTIPASRFDQLVSQLEELFVETHGEITLFSDSTPRPMLARVVFLLLHISQVGLRGMDATYDRVILGDWFNQHPELCSRLQLKARDGVH